MNNDDLDFISVSGWRGILFAACLIGLLLAVLVIACFVQNRPFKDAATPIDY